MSAPRGAARVGSCSGPAPSRAGRPSVSCARWRRERGIATVTVAVALVALLAAGALAVDAGLVWSARTQLQNVADSAALSAASNMIDPATPAVTLADAQDAAVQVAAQNSAVGTASVAVLAADLRFGAWDLATRVLDTGVDLGDPDQVTAVEVLARLDGVANRPVPALLSRVTGRTSFPVSARATGYLGFAGRVAPGEVELPIAIDCCRISGASCDQDYCDTITAEPPNFGDFATDASGNSNPCFLADGTAASCLDFYATGNQVACWTAFDEESPSISTPDLSGIVQDGNSETVDAGASYYVDNGTKTPVVGDVADRFYGDGRFTGDPAGQDLDGDGVSDSWVVGLPVIECQSDDQCAGRDTADVLGFVCFEIQEVVVTPDKRVKGRFLCPNDARFDDCDLGATGTGGLDFGVRADIPVLVR